MHIYSSKFLRRTGCCNSCPLGFRCCSFMESMPKSAVYNFSVPHSISPSGILSFSFSPPVTLSLTLGRVATLATSWLPKVVGLSHSSSTMVLFQHVPSEDVPFVILPLPVFKIYFIQSRTFIKGALCAVNYYYMLCGKGFMWKTKQLKLKSKNKLLNGLLRLVRME